MLFSVRRKAPKDSPRLPSRTLMLLLENVYPRLEGVAVLAKLAQATTPRAGSLCDRKVRACERKARAV